MEDYRININYAKALFIVANDAGLLDDVCRDMRLVNSVCAENHTLNVVFANPVVREDKKVAILKDLFESRVNKVTMLFLAFVVKKRRTINLKGISNAFVELYRDDKDIVLSRLVTATEVDDEATRAVKEALMRYTKKNIELQSYVKPELLGGFSVTFDNNMYDASLSTAVNKLRKEFSKNDYERAI